jgi:hypothetical protein
VTPDRDIFFIFAELSVALAGFSAIIGVLSGRRDSVDHKANVLRLQVMLETCFMVAAVALIPVLLDKFGIGHDAIWRVASATFLCIAIPFEFVAQNRAEESAENDSAQVQHQHGQLHLDAWGGSVAGGNLD